MGTPTVNDLDGLLSSLNQLKAPGASKNKIATITTLCVNNVQTETNIAQSFYRALKKAPATHKLGALYVIDSVVRQWIEKARASGQDLLVEGRGEPGTYPAAVKRVTELMPALFDDIIKGIPEDQKPKLQNIITIWERGNTFPAKMLAEFKAKLGIETGNGASAPVAQQSGKINYGAKFTAPIPTRIHATPVGYPPRYLYDQGFLPGRAPLPQANGSMPQPQQPAQPPVTFPPPQQTQAHAQPAQNGPPSDVNSILLALSQAAPAAPPPSFPQSTAPAPVPASALPAGLPPQLAALFQQQTLGSPAQPQFAFSAPPAHSVPPMPTPTYQAQFNGYPPQQPPSVPQVYSHAPPPQQSQQPPAADPLAQLRGLLPENILNDRQKLIPALTLLQELQKDGIPPEKWGPVLKAFEEQYQPAPNAYGGQGDQGRGRDRSRSPARPSHGGRGSPVYGQYDPNTRTTQPPDARDSRGNNQRGRYRQRSPARNDPGVAAMNGRPMQPKLITYDDSLPPDNIKVLSRTLFVGGANGTQQEIQDLFERFGEVQTCIANRDKRHAFVKMTTRQHALAAKAAMGDLQNRNDRDTMSIARQTKWGVGFGPRECCDYQRGESVIPIYKLTEADLKWLHTAEYGGTGGQQLEGGMVLEEPDIEIGAGVSSKAMSAKIANPGHGHSQKRQREDREHGGRHKKNKGGDQGYGGGYSGVSGGPSPADYGYLPTRPEPVAVATPPAVPGFGFNFGLPNGQNGFQ
ncbi:hypothetical protein AC579_480 [Lecanosticta acicola]|uniref:Uncharacterized protein n=1 Tax=Lecanosticta acicola TaxID=111012 RepID=A0AAI8YRZ8_9PEZI|nr:hypothetical protein AC579_480 [Lecanosticta acicola]